MQFVVIFPFRVNVQLAFLHFYSCATVYLLFYSIRSYLFLDVFVKSENALQIPFSLYLPNKYLRYVFISFSTYRYIFPFSGSS